MTATFAALRHSLLYNVNVGRALRCSHDRHSAMTGAPRHPRALVNEGGVFAACQGPIY